MNENKCLMAYWRQVSLARREFMATKANYYTAGNSNVRKVDDEALCDNGFNVVHWSRLAMFDWDVSSSHSIKKLNEEWELPILKTRLALLVKWGHGIRLYETPGGFRGFITSHTPSMGDWFHMAEWLHVDLSYMGFTRMRHFTECGGWARRTSPKPGRENDFVARLIRQWGPISNELAPYVGRHDKLVSHFHQ